MGGVNPSVANILLNRINSTKLAIALENIQILSGEMELFSAKPIKQLGRKFPTSDAISPWAKKSSFVKLPEGGCA